MKYLVFIAFLLATAGCAHTRSATAPTLPAESSADQGGRHLIGLDDKPLTDIWKDWHPSNAPSTPPGLGGDAMAFDYWQVTDPDFVEKAWSAIAAILGEARQHAPSKYSDSFRTLQTVLEDQTADRPRRVDITFVVAKTASKHPWEGAVFRLWRELPSGATPSVSIFLRRFAGGGTDAEDVWMWFYPGYDEAHPMTVHLEPGDGRGWVRTSAAGITFKASQKFGGDPEAVVRVASSTFWHPFVGPSYVDTSITYTEDPSPTPATLPRALGLELRDRDIDQVFSDSLFAPRFTKLPTRAATP